MTHQPSHFTCRLDHLGGASYLWFSLVSGVLQIALTLKKTWTVSVTTVELIPYQDGYADKC